MGINFNLSSGNALSGTIGRAIANIGDNVARLSSGNKIVRAGLDTVSMSQSSKMMSRISSISSGLNNLDQARSLLIMADQTLGEINNMLERMHATALRAQSPTANDTERRFLNNEFIELKDEIDRVLSETKFANRFVFRGIDRLDTETFDPSSIAGMVLWLDAADADTIEDASGNTAASSALAGGVARWRDKSGNSNDVFQANPAERPVYLANTQNDNGVVRFDGVNDRLPGIVPANGDELSTFAVFNRTGGGGSREFLYDFGNNAQGSRDIVGSQGTTPVYYNLGGGTSSRNFGNTFNFGDYNVVSTTINESDVNGFLNGAASLASNLAPRDRDSSTAFVLGDDSTSGDEWSGDIPEVLAYNRELSMEERQMVEGYLAHKWGTQGLLDLAHPYRLEPPAVARFVTDTEFVYNTGLDDRNFTFDYGEIYVEDILSAPDINLLDQESATSAVTETERGLGFVLSKRAYIGTKTNQGDRIASYATHYRGNLSEASGLFTDTNIATESTDFAKNSTQAAMAVSVTNQAQANHSNVINALLSADNQVDVLA